MTQPRDPKTGRFITKAQLIAANNTAHMQDYGYNVSTAPVRFARLWEKRCKSSVCQLKRGHTGMHARRAGFGAHHW